MRIIISLIGLAALGWMIGRQLWQRKTGRDDYIPITTERRQLLVAAEIHAREE